MRISMREAREEDLGGILEIYATAGIGGPAQFTVEEARERLPRFAQYPNYRLFVAVIEGNIAGVYSLLILDKLAKRGVPSGIVEDVAVNPAAQRQGVGRAMMEHAIGLCREAGCYKMALSSNLERTAAHQFYESLGFDRHGYSFWVGTERTK
jgi:GNAT superfamily N-acetyltransferase